MADSTWLTKYVAAHTCLLFRLLLQASQRISGLLCRIQLKPRTGSTYPRPCMSYTPDDCHSL